MLTVLEACGEDGATVLDSSETAYEEFLLEAQRLGARAGRIVVGPTFFSHADQSVLSDAVVHTLTELHRHKIDLAEEILVIDVDGYIGEATQGEIVYTAAAQKRIRYWSSEIGRDSDTSPGAREADWLVLDRAANHQLRHLGESGE